MIWQLSEFGLLLNRSENCIFNLNQVWFAKIQKRFLCVCVNSNSYLLKLPEGTYPARIATLRRTCVSRHHGGSIEGSFWVQKRPLLRKWKSKKSEIWFFFLFSWFRIIHVNLKNFEQNCSFFGYFEKWTKKKCQFFFFVRFKNKIFGYVSDDFKNFFFIKKKIAVEREPVPTRVLNPKAGGVQGRSPGWGCGGAKHLANKKKSEKIFSTKYFSRNFRTFFHQHFFSC